MDSDFDRHPDADPSSNSDILSEEEVKFYIGLVHKWFCVMREGCEPVRTSVDLENTIRASKDAKGARYQLWSLQMQCKFGKPYDSSVLRKKWENLMRTWKKLEERGVNVDNGPGTDAKTKFKYLSEMRRFFDAPAVADIASDRSAVSRDPDAEEFVASRRVVASRDQLSSKPCGSLRGRLTDVEQFHLIAVAKKALFRSPRNDYFETLVVDESWAAAMKDKFGRDYAVSELQSEWEIVSRILREEHSMSRAPSRKRSRTDMKASALRAVTQFASDLPAYRSSSDRSDGEENAEKRGSRTCVAVDEAVRELISAFRREARADRRLLRKLMTLLSRACDVPLDRFELDSDSEPCPS